MKRHTYAFAALAFLLLGLTGLLATSRDEPWRPDQLMEPADLAATIADSKAKQPLIISVGPAPTIKTSLEAGPAGKPEGLAKLDSILKNVDRNQTVVVYCGCCPFAKCPNVRPAMTKLNTMGFKQAKLLNLSTNVKVDWIDKGYPVAD